jgi:Cu/Ag efflux protein CusF
MQNAKCRIQARDNEDKEHGYQREEQMNTARRSRLVTLMAVALGVLLVLLPAAHAQQGGKKEHAFRGKVEGVDTKAKTLNVNGENVEGWMAAMTMIYAVDKEDVINHVKVGDQITAKVYDGDYKTLHDVKVVPAKSGQAPKK